MQSLAPKGVKVTVESHHGGAPVLVSTDGPVVEAMLNALEDVWKTPVRVREGGSIPIVATFSEVLQVPIMLAGFGLSDDRLHSPNEKFDIDNFYGGIRAVVRMLDRLGAAEI